MKISTIGFLYVVVAEDTKGHDNLLMASESSEVLRNIMKPWSSNENWTGQWHIQDPLIPLVKKK